MNELNVMDRDFFTDASSFYVNPPEPVNGDDVKVKLRVIKSGADEVFLHVTNGEAIKMNLSKNESKEADKYFDYYEAVVPNLRTSLNYHFGVRKGNDQVFISNTEKECDQNKLDKYQFFNIPIDFKLPGDRGVDSSKHDSKRWVGQRYYQILVDKFSKGDTRKYVQDEIKNMVALDNVVAGEYEYIGKPITKAGRRQDPAHNGADAVREFHGGNIAGILDNLDYLQKLGIDVIYLNPINPSPSSHGYDISDFRNINPRIGVRLLNEDGTLKPLNDPENLKESKKLFKVLIDEAHSRGMKLVMDGVYNHCSNEHPWYKEACADKNSKYVNYFNFTDKRDEAWPNNKSAETWWGNETLIKLNYDCPELVQEIYSTIMDWLDMGVDGFRFDVAFDIGKDDQTNSEVFKMLKKLVLEKHPDALLIAESYGNVRGKLQGDQVDTTMGYDVMDRVTAFFTGMEKHGYIYNSTDHKNAKKFFEDIIWKRMDRTMQADLLQWVMTDNHDHARASTLTNGKVAPGQGEFYPGQESIGVNWGVFKGMMTTSWTLTGNPMIFAGTELGTTGYTEPNCRKPFDSEKANLNVLNYFSALNRMYKTYNCINESFIPLYCDGGTMAYGRFGQNDHLITVNNMTEQEKEIEIEVTHAEIFDNSKLKKIMNGDPNGHSLSAEDIQVKDGKIKVKIAPYATYIFGDKDVDFQNCQFDTIQSIKQEKELEQTKVELKQTKDELETCKKELDEATKILDYLQEMGYINDEIKEIIKNEKSNKNIEVTEELYNSMQIEEMEVIA